MENKDMALPEAGSPWDEKVTADCHAGVLSTGVLLIAKTPQICTLILAMWRQMSIKGIVLIKSILLDNLPRDGSVFWEGCLFLICTSALWASRGPGLPLTGRCSGWN